MAVPSFLGTVCPDLGAIISSSIASDDYYLVARGPALIFNLLGTTSVLLICLLFLLKLTLPWSCSRYLTRTVMAYVVFRVGLLGFCVLEVARSQQSPNNVPSDDGSVGQLVLPNIQDPQAVDAQTVCPGYIASDVHTSDTGLTANLNLAGSACNLYGNDIENLTLAIEYQDASRIHVQIQPRFIGPENETWFILPEAIVPKAASSGDATSESTHLTLSWTNNPTFSFTMSRKSSGDTLFTTEGSRLVYEDQFIEFVSPLPKNYNLYGLGEVIHGFRLGNNLTSESLRIYTRTLA